MPGLTIRNLGLLGTLSLLPYAAALRLNDLRANTVGFEVALFAAFILYALAVLLVLRAEAPTPKRVIALVVGFAVAFRLLLVFTTPTLTDDMYRYVWDGRVQAHGINPYLLPPDAPALIPLRDDAIWPLINRKPVVTVYPGGAQVAFAMLWRIAPDNVHWFQIAMAAGDVLAGVLLRRLLTALGQPANRALVYLWNPLGVFETAHAAHVHGRDRRPASGRSSSRPGHHGGGRRCQPGILPGQLRPPTHVGPGLAQPGAWHERIVGIRSNASTKSHTELDEATKLDEGDTQLLAAAHDRLKPLLPRLSIIGGCCGTDARHVASLWSVDRGAHPRL